MPPPPSSSPTVAAASEAPAARVALPRRIFGIDEAEVSFARRGFARTSPEIVERLERVALSFVLGYHLALEQPDTEGLRAVLAPIDDVHRGFAYEGAGMALELLDRVTPWRKSRLRAFLDGPGRDHIYMVTIGAGWAWARLPLRVAPQRRRLDPVTGWLALDGYGFHEGFFHTEASVRGQSVPRRIRDATARRVFDTGLGRSLWFVCGADIERIAETVASFEVDRQRELWAGVGLACSYAGGACDADVDHLCLLAAPHRAALAQGAAFAAKARERAATPAMHTQRAVERICGGPAEVAANLCDTALAEAREAARNRPGASIFELWRAKIRSSFQQGFGSQEEPV